MGINAETWTEIDNDWFFVCGRSGRTCRLSFKPKKDVSDYGWDDWEPEADKIILEEGAEFPYGYEPLYRDRGTLALVMRRNRSLTTEQAETARENALDWEAYCRLRAKFRAIRSEGDWYG